MHFQMSPATKKSVMRTGHGEDGPVPIRTKTQHRHTNSNIH